MKQDDMISQLFYRRVPGNIKVDLLIMHGWQNKECRFVMHL